MLRTVEMELTSVISPVVSWKNISKGKRNTPRRAKKSIARSCSQEPVEAPRRVEDLPVSESEKTGATVLGGRFSYKIEHMPIKKRRILFRSPSPPPQIPSFSEMSERPVKSLPDSGQKASFANVLAKEKSMAGQTAVIDQNNSEEIVEKFSEGNALEGVVIEQELFGQEGSLEVRVNAESNSIAKKSCKEKLLSSTGISNDRIESSTSAASVEETTASPKSLVSGKDMVDCFSPDNSVCASQNLPSSNDDGIRRKITSDRLYWDLNTSMDAWENPCNDPDVGSQVNDTISEDGLDSGKLGNVEGCVKQSDLGDTKYDMEATVHSMVDSATCLEGKVSFEEAELFHNQVGSKTNRESDAALVVPARNTSTLVETCLTDVNASSQSSSFSSTGNSGIQSSYMTIVGIDESINNHGYPGADHNSSEPMGVEKKFEAPTISVMQKEYICTAEEQSDSSKPCGKISGKTSCEINGILTEEAGFFDNGNAPENIRNSFVMTCQPLVPVPLYKVSPSQSSPNLGELSGLYTSFGKDKLVVAVDTMVQDDKDFGTETAAVDSPDSKLTDNSSGVTRSMVFISNCFSSHKVSRSNGNVPVNSSSKFASEDDFGDISYDSYISQDDTYHMEKTTEVQSGYDSQYEDGELRESIVDTWEEDASEEGEAELLDYGSDNAQVEEEKECEKEKSIEQILEKNVIEGSSKAAVGSGMKIAVKVEKKQLGKQFARNYKVEKLGSDIGVGKSNAVAIEKDSNAKKTRTGAHMDGFDVRYPMAIASRRDLSLRDGPRVVPAWGIRSANFDDSNYRVERDSDSGKSTGRGRNSLPMHGRGWDPEHRVDSSVSQWGPPGHHHSPRIYGSAGFDMFSDRRINVARGRSGRCGPQVAGTSLRGRYSRPTPADSTDSFMKTQHHFGRGERSFSPIHRSPRVWSSPRGRNGGDFVDAVDDIREHGYSKARSSVSHSRSPERIFSQKQRFNFKGPSGRLKPGENWRPAHHGRSPGYEESVYDRRKCSAGYGMVHPPRHYDRDGYVKRACFDEDDTEFRRLGDVPRGAREEKSHFRYGRGDKFYSNSESFGTEHDEDLAPRMRRS